MPSLAPGIIGFTSNLSGPVTAQRAGPLGLLSRSHGVKYPYNGDADQQERYEGFAASSAASYLQVVPRKKEVTSCANYEDEHAGYRLIWPPPMDEVSTSCHLADLTGINWAMLARDHRGSGGPRCAVVSTEPPCYIRRHIHTYMHTALRRIALMPLHLGQDDTQHGSPALLYGAIPVGGSTSRGFLQLVPGRRPARPLEHPVWCPGAGFCDGRGDFATVGKKMHNTPLSPLSCKS
ncbi:hypothetical protein LA080_016318 [Diaporthe eres]|nr:hypothetical protein LA080_016318 [Diaporthe eres]